jgi:mRNA interferase MazF
MLPGNMTGLSKESVANVTQIITIDNHFLSDRINRLPASLMRRIDAGIRLVLSL